MYWGLSADQQGYVKGTHGILTGGNGNEEEEYSQNHNFNNIFSDSDISASMAY